MGIKHVGTGGGFQKFAGGASDLFQPQGTVLPVEVVTKALAELDAKGRERFTLLQAYGVVRELDVEAYKKLRSPGNLARPMCGFDELRQDLDNRVGEAVRRVCSKRGVQDLKGRWPYGLQEDYLNAVQGVLTRFWNEEFIRLGVRHIAGTGVPETTENLSRVSDVVLRKAVEESMLISEKQHGRPSSDFVVVVTGSYGRRELLPNSDVDACWIYSSDGTTEGVKTGGMFDGLSVLSNRDFFSVMLSTTAGLLSGTGIRNQHARGPKTLDEFRGVWEGSVPDCMNMLNSSVVYETGGMFQKMMGIVAQTAYDPKKIHRYISSMIRSREKEIGLSSEKIRDELLGLGVEALSLKFGRGGERSVLYLSHMGQLLDPCKPEDKIVKHNRTIRGLMELTKLGSKHPLGITEDEARGLQECLNQFTRINIDLRLRYPQLDIAWNPVRPDDLEYLGGIYGMPARAYEREVLQMSLGKVDTVWSRIAGRYTKSRMYVK